MAGGGGPEVGVLEGMEDRAVAARRLAEDPASAGAAAAEAAFHQRHHLPDQNVFPGAERGRVDVLLSAKPGEPGGGGDRDRQRVAGRASTDEGLGQGISETTPATLRLA